MGNGRRNRKWCATEKKPKKMRKLDVVALVLGVVLLFAYGLGLILILAAFLDYAFLTKEQTKFIPR